MLDIELLRDPVLTLLRLVRGAQQGLGVLAPGIVFAEVAEDLKISEHPLSHPNLKKSYLKAHKLRKCIL